MPNQTFTGGTWTALPVSGTTKTASVINPAAVPLYLVAFDAQGNWMRWAKVQASGSATLTLPTGWSTVKALMRDTTLCTVTTT